MVTAIGDHTTMLVRFLNKDQTTPKNLNNILFSGFDWAPEEGFRKKAQVTWYNDETGLQIGSTEVYDMGDYSSYLNTASFSLPNQLITHIVGWIITYQEEI